MWYIIIYLIFISDFNFNKIKKQCVMDGRRGGFSVAEDNGWCWKM